MQIPTHVKNAEMNEKKCVCVCVCFDVSNCSSMTLYIYIEWLVSFQFMLHVRDSYLDYYHVHSEVKDEHSN